MSFLVTLLVVIGLAFLGLVIWSLSYRDQVTARAARSANKSARLRVPDPARQGSERDTPKAPAEDDQAPSDSRIRL